jgi:hypothetical protein
MLLYIGCVSCRRLALLCFIITLLSCKQPTEDPKENRAIAEHTSFYLYFRDDQDMIHQTEIRFSNGAVSVGNDSILPIFVFRDSVSMGKESFIKWQKLMLGNKDSLSFFQDEFNQELTKARLRLTELMQSENWHRGNLKIILEENITGIFFGAFARNTEL